MEAEFENECWKLKQNFDSVFKGAFSGVRGKKRDFKSKLLQEAKNNSAALETYESLSERAETLFGETPQKISLIPKPDFNKLFAIETNPILAKKIIGKSDVDIAAMIQKLGNSDWVKQGRPFYEINDGFCPFCQQETEDSLATSLTEYFDEAYEKDTSAIDDLYDQYRLEITRSQEMLKEIMEDPPRFLDSEKLESEAELFDSETQLNLQHLQTKRDEPSVVISLNSLRNVSDAIHSITAQANQAITAHNKMVENLQQERDRLASQIWKYLLEKEIKNELSAYNKQKTNLNKAISALALKIRGIEADIINKKTEIRELEKDTTSIQPTIDAINSLLRSFGFTGFPLSAVWREPFL